MSGLSYICDYGGSHSEDSDEERLLRPAKKKKLPTPNLNQVTVVPHENHIDDPSLHGGRKRAFPHMRGNWATFVYIDHPHKESLQKTTDTLTDLIQSFDKTFIKCEDYHISLSKTFVLRYHTIKSFTDSLQEILSTVKSFELSFDCIEVYTNEEKTRTFLALKLNSWSQTFLWHISTNIDNILKEFKLPTFYERPSYHISILSISGNKQAEISKELHKFNEQIFNKEVYPEPFFVQKINCKSGNKYYQYSLD